MSGKGIILLFLICFLTTDLSAELKDYIAIVKPMYHEKTRALFYDLADYFENMGNENLKWYFINLAEEHGHGTGWVIVDEQGNNYIITNMHVVNQAERVNIYFERPDGTQKAYYDAPIIYVDNYMDLAVCRFPDGERVFQEGFELERARARDLMQVISAGFPGFGSTPLWQVALGNITNSAARINPVYEYLIQHSAPIDPGNSGGPLLVEDSQSELGYKVIGVNTWKANSRESTNFAIPIKDVLRVLSKAKNAERMREDSVSKREALIKSCRILASELGSENPEFERVRRFISYAYVGEQGWMAFNGILNIVDNPQEWEDWFFDDPIEAMRSSIYWLFWQELQMRGDITEITFSEINYADDEEINIKRNIRTNFLISGKKTEIIWTLEYGQWKISNLKFQSLEINGNLADTSSSTTTSTVDETRTTTVDTTVTEELIFGEIVKMSIRGGMGITDGVGSVYDMSVFEDGFDWLLFSWSIGAVFETPLIPPVIWMAGGAHLAVGGRGIGADLTDLGWYYFEDEVIYLQLPAYLTFYLPEGFFLSAGFAGNIAVVMGGKYWKYYNSDNKFDLTYENYYKDFLSVFALSLYLAAGFEANLGSSAFGLEFTYNSHLTNDYDYLYLDGTSHNYRFLLGGYLKFDM